MADPNPIVAVTTAEPIPAPAPQTGEPATEPDDSTQTVAQIIREVHAGTRDAKLLDPETRAECVHQLTLDGYSNDQIAAVMRISERSVRRDRAAARLAHAIKPTRWMGDQLLGEYESLTLTSIRRLTRLCSDDNTPPYVRMWAEESIGRVYHRFMEMARRLNYFRDGAGRLDYEAQIEASKAPLAPKTPFEKLQETIDRRLGFIQ